MDDDCNNGGDGPSSFFEDDIEKKISLLQTLLRLFFEFYGLDSGHWPGSLRVVEQSCSPWPWPDSELASIFHARREGSTRSYAQSCY